MEGRASVHLIDSGSWYSSCRAQHRGRQVCDPEASASTTEAPGRVAARVAISPASAVPEIVNERLEIRMRRSRRRYHSARGRVVSLRYDTKVCTSRGSVLRSGCCIMYWGNHQRGRPGRVPCRPRELPGLQKPRSTICIAPLTNRRAGVDKVMSMAGPHSLHLRTPRLSRFHAGVSNRPDDDLCASLWAVRAGLTRHSISEKLAAESSCLHCCMAAHSPLVVSATSLTQLCARA